MRRIRLMMFLQVYWSPRSSRSAEQRRRCWWPHARRPLAMSIGCCSGGSAGYVSACRSHRCCAHRSDRSAVHTRTRVGVRFATTWHVPPVPPAVLGLQKLKSRRRVRALALEQRVERLAALVAR
mmetsp:Transcript_26238/g.67816  ORF Transcript_26238/g.67816 Transcript_26238/m.67816 type:complete len:124 (-) Transcript_26238:596-967(-)